MEDNTEILVEVKALSKKLCRDLNLSLWYGMTDFFNMFFNLKNQQKNKLRKQEFWAVKEASFTLKRGECIGLLGHNGAGKSTLLKMLNGLIKPDQGEIIIHGKVGALIDLGVGFNPLLTGRENIYVNGQLLGLTKKEVDEKMDAIIAFAEIEKFIDSPVQNYSSGMKVRLGFSIAVQIEPDVLLIDEVLAVGDVGFVLKCFNKMDELRSKTAMIFVSHSMPQISRMCSQILLLKNGETVYQSDDVATGITQYYRLFNRELGNFFGSEKVHFEHIRVLRKNEVNKLEPDTIIHYGDTIVIEIKLDVKEKIHHPNLALTFYDTEQKSFAEVLNFNDCLKPDAITGKVVIAAELSNMPFSQGRYSVSVDLTGFHEGVRTLIFRYQSACYFDVHSKHHGWAPVQLETTWEIKNYNT